jgi:hypothetical protein
MLEWILELAREEIPSPMTDKKTLNLKAFIENVNKKDKRNGLKIRFDFVKRKRK